MTARALFVGMFAAFVMGSAASAFAADMYDGTYPPQAGSPYDDPRYADIYRHPPSRYGYQDEEGDEYDYEGDRGDGPAGYGERPYGHVYDNRKRYDRAGGDDDRFSAGGSFKDDDADWDGNGRLPPPQRYADRFDYWRHGVRCVDPTTIRRRLEATGWRHVRDLALRGDYAVIRARRHLGPLFDLRIDRCTGAIVSARRSFDGYPGYAYSPRRFGPAY